MNARYRKLDEVWTSDSQKLGLAQRLFHRTEGVEPANLLYESYLEVENFELGSTYFVPTDFIEESEEDLRPLTVGFSDRTGRGEESRSDPGAGKVRLPLT